MAAVADSKQRQETEFAEFLERIESEGPSGEEDRERIALFPNDRPTRRERPIPLHPPLEPEDDDVRMNLDFMAHGNHGGKVPVYKTINEGISAFGWSPIPKRPKELAGSSGRMTPEGVFLGEGAFGYVLLAYMKTEAKVKLEHRHLCGLKVQPQEGEAVCGAEDVASAWVEINVLRGCVHPNIIAYYGHFIVIEDEKSVEEMSIAMILEYASARDLMKEVTRYAPDMVPETGARYYGKQIMSGLAYLHRKLVTHNDLHSDNILLRYNSDLTKTAMLADFGAALVHDPAAVQSGVLKFDTLSDVCSFVRLIKLMVLPANTRVTDVSNVSTDLKQMITDLPSTARKTFRKP